jgi:hypothetical protein
MNYIVVFLFSFCFLLAPSEEETIVLPPKWVAHADNAATMLLFLLGMILGNKIQWCKEDRIMGPTPRYIVTNAGHTPRYSEVNSNDKDADSACCDSEAANEQNTIKNPEMAKGFRTMLKCYFIFPLTVAKTSSDLKGFTM